NHPVLEHQSADGGTERAREGPFGLLPELKKPFSRYRSAVKAVLFQKAVDRFTRLCRTDVLAENVLDFPNRGRSLHGRERKGRKGIHENDRLLRFNVGLAGQE